MSLFRLESRTWGLSFRALGHGERLSSSIGAKLSTWAFLSRQGRITLRLWALGEKAGIWLFEFRPCWEQGFPEVSSN